MTSAPQPPAPSPEPPAPDAAADSGAVGVGDPGFDDGNPAAPRSARFGDVYFSLEDGLAESRAVFLAGCGLPEAWAGRRRFVVGELGFGSGLNIAALLTLWRRTRPPSGRLSVFTVEGFPLTAAQAASALRAFPEVAEAAEALLARWPRRAAGLHRLELPDFAASVDVAQLPVAEALAGWTGRADAWFLDGFAPAANPDMWSEAVLAAVAARSAPGARLATFTVAGAVRRGLAGAGAEVAKLPGHGRKRERLEARLPGVAVEPPAPRVAVIGAGIAGAAVTRALTALRLDALLVDAGRGDAASGNPAALAGPRFDAGGGPVAALFAQALARAADLYGATPNAVLSRGALQLEQTARDTRRFDAVAAQALYAPGALLRLGAEEVSHRMGEPQALGGLWVADARVIRPAAVLAAWTAGVPRRTAEAARLEQADGLWRLLDAAGAPIAEAEAVVLAGGAAVPRLWPDLALAPVRGQISVSPADVGVEAAAFGGYVLPLEGGVLFGATHGRGDTDTDERLHDHNRNLETVAARLPQLALRLVQPGMSGRAAVRATTADRLPVAGELAPGFYVLSGLGSRGFTAAPLLAEHVAATIAGAPSPLPAAVQALLRPDRPALTASRTPRS